jgi:uncharacterized membrane protein YGL010W
MKTRIDQPSHYAADHRDRRDIATHVVGIPMIVRAVATLRARPRLLSLGSVESGHLPPETSSRLIVV